MFDMSDGSPASGTIGSGAVLYYEYGEGRLQLADPGNAPLGAPAGGNAITDTNGLPVFVVPSGVAVSTNNTPVTPGPEIYYTDYTTGASGAQSGNPGGMYSGFYYSPAGQTSTGYDSMSVYTTSPNFYIGLLGANNAATVTSGNNDIECTAVTSNYVVSGTGNDLMSFSFSDHANVADTVANFHIGDVLSLKPTNDYWNGASTGLLEDLTTSTGQPEAALVFDLSGHGASDITVLFPGLASATIKNNFSLTFDASKNVIQLLNPTSTAHNDLFAW